MKIALIGRRNVGKTTLFNAFTGAEVPVTSWAEVGAAPRVGMARVADPRVDRLHALYHPRKTTYAAVEFVDAPGLAEEGEGDRGFSDLSLEWIRTADALALVVRNFDDGRPEPPDPAREGDALVEELLLSDLLAVEKRIERIRWAADRGKMTPALAREEALLAAARTALEEGRPLSASPWSPDDEKLMRGFHFLSRKPLVVLVNSSEERFGQSAALLASLAERHPTLELAGALEMEVGRLPAADREVFLADLGLQGSARDRVVRFAYDLLGALTFFTVGEDEVRAWTVSKGNTALEAAGAIHSDLARGFIRAECFTYDDLMAAGTERGVKERGLLRLEGRAYPVKDGDILSIRFSV